MAERPPKVQIEEIYDALKDLQKKFFVLQTNVTKEQLDVLQEGERSINFMRYSTIPRLKVAFGLAEVRKVNGFEQIVNKEWKKPQQETV